MMKIDKIKSNISKYTIREGSLKPTYIKDAIESIKQNISDINTDIKSKSNENGLRSNLKYEKYSLLFHESLLSLYKSKQAYNINKWKPDLFPILVSMSDNNETKTNDIIDSYIVSKEYLKQNDVDITKKILSLPKFLESLLYD